MTLLGRYFLTGVARSFHSSRLVCKNTRVGVVRRTRNQSIPLTYEQAKKPHQIGLMKSWNSWNTSNLENECLYTSDITVQDELIRAFIRGTFPVAVESEVIIKRQWNVVRIAFLLSSRVQPIEAHFLIGYSEELLSHLLRCLVKLEVQVIASKKDVVFRYI
ncbi:28S ribosomal protein S24, mitochondrial [Clonorchis sinensis]|uniref:28S ribosomal protein S24, mitochondrial n=1 Tax=Clonorchis sinensis TaxID=79923 RepID=A0A3R7CCJ5_CLOSI|nr:28S ribosomal protein S24, mitochondrial [Clonorchis sinensis]